MVNAKVLTLSVVLLVVLGTLIENQVDACSCQLIHPQDQFCQSDFVIVARIRRELKTATNKIYKAKIKKEFKMSEKARVALKSGRILTGLEDSLCGVNLDVGKVYLITGRIFGLQAHINLCGFSKPWREVTSRQRKGFRLIYSRGCDCKISYYHHMPQIKEKCSWTNIPCHEKYGICLRSPSGQCNWSKSIDLKRCLTGELNPKPRIINEFHQPPRENQLSINKKHHYARFHYDDDKKKETGRL